MTRRWKFRISVFSAAMLFSLAPVAFSAERGVAASVAECATCCKEADSTCIICKTDCFYWESSYSISSGSTCSKPFKPNVPG
jgi:hypothetical protein